MEVHWNTPIDGRFRKYEEGTIKRLVTMHDNQPTESIQDKDGFLSTNATTPVLKRGNSMIITLWDSAPEEVSEALIYSCDIHSFIDDEMVLSYG